VINPSVDSLKKNVDSKYTLVISAAKRARQIVENNVKETDSKKKKPVSKALQEIEKGKIKYRRPETESLK